ncbi:DUF4865 family protein [Kitasatospora sp. NPDC088134]|uniref:DUF4865 family protein n=1 Tax=Kitasatospora sp. NPDC088134 TaxID=3364071 RepID=UPI0037F2EEE7
MQAKQYAITLPADYDLDVVRRRIAAGAPLLDDRAGLGFKAWLLRERGTAGSPVNEYAPFYVWRSDGELARFLVGGGGFENIVRDFGRPVVRHWTVLAQFAGPARTGERDAPAPASAVRSRSAVPVGGGPQALAGYVEREVERLREAAREPGVHTALLALDPDRWELLRFTLRTDRPGAAPEEGTEVFGVPHLSAPGLAYLPEGRAW